MSAVIEIGSTPSRPLSALPAFAQMLRLRLLAQSRSWGWRVAYLTVALAFVMTSLFMRFGMEHGMRQARPGNGHALPTIARLIDANAPRPAAPAMLRGVPVDVHALAPHMKSDASAALAWLGARPVETGGDITVREELMPSAAGSPHAPASRWVVTLRPTSARLDPQERFAALVALKQALERPAKERYRAWQAAQPLPPASALVPGWEVRDELTRSLAARMVACMVMIAWLWPIINLFSGFVGLEWDMRRTDGSLEPWNLVVQPLWVMYGAQVAAAALHVAVFCAIGMTVTTLALPGSFLGWPLVLTVPVLAFSLAVLIGMLGMLSTMLFRHRHGRMFARMILAPTSMVAISGFVLMGDQLGRLGGSVIGLLNNPWLPAGVLGLAALALVGAGVLAWIVERRIGVMRQGLRML